MTELGESTSISLDTVVDYLDQLLETSTTPDFPNAINGLQLANSGTVRKVAAAVDFSARTVAAAAQENADLLIVHHGMFWLGTEPLVGTRYERIRMLIDRDIAVYSSHLPLDRHPLLGNNALLARTLELEPSDGFARFKDIFIGVMGTSDIRTSTLIERARSFSRMHGGETIAPGVQPDRVTRRWAICTGNGASADTLREAIENNVDTLIVGEGPHWTAVDAAEKNIVIIYMGHYATETLGVYAIAAELERKFHIDAVNLSAPTGL
ncbi:MAG TPA: Nif3-like dinuclear metal center hexameric protein [Gemmatimonadaceae bacterium]|nr:Nif3-like dinuclear metal center hexameric protein [Gemmatimonadaceae bacterium]